MIPSSTNRDVPSEEQKSPASVDDEVGLPVIVWKLVGFSENKVFKITLIKLNHLLKCTKKIKHKNSI